MVIRLRLFSTLASVDPVLVVILTIDNYLYTGSSTLDFAASSTSRLVNFASFPGLRASSGVASRRLFL